MSSSIIGVDAVCNVDQEQRAPRETALLFTPLGHLHWLSTRIMQPRLLSLGRDTEGLNSEMMPFL